MPVSKGAPLSLSLAIIDKRVFFPKNFFNQLELLVSALLQSGYKDYAYNVVWDSGSGNGPQKIGTLKLESLKENSRSKKQKHSYESKCRIVFNERAPEPWNDYSKDVNLVLKINPYAELFEVVSIHSSDPKVTKFLNQWCELTPATIQNPVILSPNSEVTPLDCARLCAAAYSYKHSGLSFPHESIENVFAFIERALEAGAPITHQEEASRKIAIGVCQHAQHLAENPHLLRFL